MEENVQVVNSQSVETCAPYHDIAPHDDLKTILTQLISLRIEFHITKTCFLNEQNHKSLLN